MNDTQSGDTKLEYPSVHRSTSSSEFFTGAADGKLLLRECSQCGHLRAARRPNCRGCGSHAALYHAARGTGQLISWGVHPPARGRAAWAFGLIELSEGPWLEARLAEADPADLWAGMPVVVTFVRGAEGDPYPAFLPADHAIGGRAGSNES
jgi:uncharacterized OB-fold protein